MRTSRPPRVKGPDVQGRPDLAQRPAKVPVGVPAIRAVEAEDQAHGGGLSRPVQAEKANGAARPDIEAELVDGDHRAVPLSQAANLDHRPASFRSWLARNAEASHSRARCDEENGPLPMMMAVSCQ